MWCIQNFLLIAKRAQPTETRIFVHFFSNYLYQRPKLAMSTTRTLQLQHINIGIILSLTGIPNDACTLLHKILISQSRVLWADWLTLEKDEKTTLHPKMPYHLSDNEHSPVMSAIYRVITWSCSCDPSISKLSCIPSIFMSNLYFTYPYNTMP